MTSRGDFIPLGDDRILMGIRELITLLEGVHSHVTGEHILNLLEDVKKLLPDDKQRMLSVIDLYLTLVEEQRLVFRLKRRKVIYRNLDDLADTATFLEMKKIIDHCKQQKKGLADKIISSLVSSYLLHAPRSQRLHGNA